MVVDTQDGAIDEDRVFHALADRTRRDILARTLRAELSVSEIARGYPIRHSAVQKHVAVLAGAGLVRERRHGREKRVAADPDVLHAAARALDDLAAFWRERFAAMDDILAAERPGRADRSEPGDA